MRIEIIQQTLRAKDELDVIIGTIDVFTELLSESDLDEIYEDAMCKMRETKRVACSARLSLSDAFDSYCENLGVKK